MICSRFKLIEMEKLKNIIKEAVEKLKESHSFILDRNNDVAELAVSTKLASIIEPYFINNYDVDAEWNRMRDKHGGYVPKRLQVPNDNLVQPDIIIHKRGSNDANLLVIEIKMTWKSQRKDFDFQKIEAYITELDYKNGLYLELGENGIVEDVWF